MRRRASTGWFALALLAGCGGGIAVVGGDAPQAVTARDAAYDDAPDIVAPDVVAQDVVAPDIVAMDAPPPPLDATTEDARVEPRDGIGRVDSVASEAATPDSALACVERCGFDEVCCNGRCVDPRIDPLHCGACGNRCAPSTQCVSGACTGACGSDQLQCGSRCVPASCAQGNGACARQGPVRCVRGEPVCEAVAGAPGTEVCNNVDDDCDGMTDEALTQPCFMGAGSPNVGLCRAGAQACVNGAWGACQGMVGPTTETCDGRDENCNGVADDGVADLPCFTFTQGMRNVGRCRDGLRRCVGGTRSACVGEVGPLPEICNLQDDDCNGMTDDAVNLSLCPGRPNTRATACAAGACQYACLTSYANCDGNIDNGCEANTTTSLQHCGGCNRPCPGGQLCDNGACRTNCSTGTVCNGQCVDPSTNIQHCGGCNRPCPAPPGGVAQCVSGLCTQSCNTGLAFCGATCVNLASDFNHCGTCNNACRSTQVCMLHDGAPTCVCTNGQIDCNGQCVSAQSDAFNCGACGVRCQTGQRCESGACQFVSPPDAGIDASVAPPDAGTDLGGFTG